MKRLQFIGLFLLIVSNIAVAQQLNFQRPDIVGRWQVIESWDMTLSDRLEIAKTNVLRGFDNVWIFKDNQELLMIDPLHMVDPIRQTYLYHWYWLNDTTLCVVPGSKDIFLLCHLLDYSPSRLVFISSVAENDPRYDSPSLYVLRVLRKTD
jgi:hypothetical protein